MTQKLKPKLTLLIGPAGCGKTQVCTEAFDEAISTSSNLLADDHLFILPTAEHRARTIDLVLRRGLPGFFQRRITTFDRSLRELLRLGGLDFATDVTRRIILEEIFSRLKLQYFEGATQTAGFLELISRTIVELKEYLIRPDEFEKRLASLKKRFPEFALKYDDLIHIYQAYEHELKERNLTDQRDSLRLLEEGLNRGEFQSPELKCVWIDGFSDFSKLQLAFIEFLTRHANEVTVTLTVARDPFRSPLFSVVSETQAALEDMGFQKTWVEGKNYRSPGKTLQHLEQNLFREGKATKISPDATVQVFEATGLLGEIEMIAREIKRLVRAHDYHFSDIALLFRNTDPYIQVIQNIFRKFEIPVEIHERFRLRTSPVARTLMSFFEILLNDWNRKDLFNFLKSSYVRRDYELISELELRALQRGIFRDRTYWLESFPQAEAFQDIAHFEDQFRNLKTVNDFSKWVSAVMNHFGLLSAIQNGGSASLLGGDFPDFADEKTRSDRESARRIMLLLEELKRKSRFLDGASPSAFAKEFLALIYVDLYSVHGQDKNRVQVYNISLARQKEYKAVFLAGLLEKQFPIQIKEDPILSDVERRVLNEKGEVLRERLPRQAFERYLFYLAVTRANERLILSYPRFDLEGKEALPSFYVEEVRAVFKEKLAGKKQHITEVLPSWNDIATVREAEERIIQDLWAIPSRGIRSCQSGYRIAFALYNRLIARSEFAGLIRRLLQPIEGVITDERIKSYFASPEKVWSPTLLEEYGECPYRYFAHRHLHLESQAEGIDIKRKGTILHDVLEQFFTWQRDIKKGKVSFTEAKEFCLRKFDEFWQEEPLRGERYYKIELERKKMQEMIIQILRVELIEKKPPIAGLVPAYFEYEFKDLILKGERREIMLRGKIDRIDLDSEGKYGLVIDYKTGKKFNAKFLKNGVLLQLPFYLIAAREKLGLKPLGGHLYSLSKTASTGFHHKDNLAEAGIATRKGSHFPGKEFDEVIHRSIRFAEKFVGGIEHAEIPVKPRDCVSYCPYSAVCRIEKWRLEHIYREIDKEDRESMSEKERVGKTT